jgi:hypothetical protein
MKKQRWLVIILALAWLAVLIIGAQLAEAQTNPTCPTTGLDDDQTVIVVPAAGVNVRSAAGGAIIDHLPVDSVLHTDGWPVCRDGVLWWRVTYTPPESDPVEDRTGWVAERIGWDAALLLPAEAVTATYVPTATATLQPATASPTPSPTLTPSQTPTLTATLSATTSRQTPDATRWSEPFMVMAVERP